MRHSTAGRTLAVIVSTLAALTLLTPSAQANQARREVAVTFDDLPMVTYTSRDIAVHERLTASLVTAIRQHRVPAIGFVNEGKLVSNSSVDERQVALLQHWVEGGLELGNHTYSHLDLHRTPLGEYLRDIARGDSVTAEILRSVGREPRYFRHPFLHTGRDLTIQRSVKRFLTKRGYEVAPVTIDNSDYAFAAAYDRAARTGDEEGCRQIATAYLDYMERVFAYYERQSVALLGREVRQVLLLHANRLNAEYFGALISMIRRRGYQFVSLQRALGDPAYSLKDDYTGPAGISWLHRWALTRGKAGTFFTGEPAVPEAITKSGAY